jgi:hypothetical protein
MACRRVIEAIKTSAEEPAGSGKLYRISTWKAPDASVPQSRIISPSLKGSLMRVSKLSFTTAVRIVLCALLCVSAAVAPSQAEEITAKIPGRKSHEGSSLLRVENAPLLRANGWKRAFWVAFDEGKTGSPLGLLGQRNDDSKWELREVSLTPRDDQSRIDDTEALARKGGFIYLIGSHFGKKKGTLEAIRQFVARFRESEVQGASPEAHLDIRRDDFQLHRLLNDALAQRNVDLITRGTSEENNYIKKTQESGESGRDRVKKDDRALNIEGATFLESGQLALGLRYPVTSQGEPLVLVLDDVDALFPKVVAVWSLRGAGSPTRLHGIRALESAGGEIQAIVGSIERTSPESPLLKDHAGADQITSEHRAFTVPALGETSVNTRLVRDLAPAGNVEGLWVDDCGDWYVFDEDEQVHVRREVRP